MRFIDPDGKDLWDVMLGTAHAIGENLTLGLAQYDNSSVSSASDYNAGRSIGDVVSVVMGALEIGAGGSVSGGGVAVAVGSGGSLSLIGVPVAAEGVAMVAHGVGVVATAVKSIDKQEGRISESNKSGITNSHSKDGGKNGKKINAKREQSWKEKEMDARSRKK